MRFITEERLKELMFEWDGIYPFVQSCKFLIENECEELDNLTVTKLRPMSEAIEQDKEILLCPKNGREFIIGWLEGQGRYYVSDDIYYTADQLEGWIPIPIYKPE